jgi:hypothetical protein
MIVATDVLLRLANLNIDRSNGTRKQYNPLPLPVALQNLIFRGERDIAFVDIERTL